MHLSYLIVILLFVVAGWCLWHKFRSSDPTLEHMGGYGTLSGLYFNNNGNRYTFKNIYDPISYPGYTTTIGKVVQ